MGGEKRREKSLRNGVHHANAVVWEPVYRTRLLLHDGRGEPRLLRRDDEHVARARRLRDVTRLADPGVDQVRREPSGEVRFHPVVANRSVPGDHGRAV
eukprot:29515-Pelagococcus_subviridis.AAC.6